MYFNKTWTNPTIIAKPKFFESLQFIHINSGEQKTALHGYSILFACCGPFLLLFKQDWANFMITITISLLITLVNKFFPESGFFATIIFLIVYGNYYNNIYIRKLLTQGFIANNEATTTYLKYYNITTKPRGL